MTYAEPIMALLCERGPMSISEISEALGCNRRSVCASVSSLKRFRMVRVCEVRRNLRNGQKTPIYEVVE